MLSVFAPQQKYFIDTNGEMRVSSEEEGRFSCCHVWYFQLVLPGIYIKTVLCKNVTCTR